MRNKPRNFCLILALALLQCLVPLLHAHAGGLHVSSHAHVHIGVPVLHQASHFPEFTADSSDFPVVGAASEFKRDPASDDLASASLPPFRWSMPPWPPVPSASRSSSILPESAFFSGSPPSQAPPIAC